MKYLAAILIGALVIGGALTAAVYVVFGANPGYVFAKFLAAPAGLIAAAVLFIVYDTRWPKKVRPQTQPQPSVQPPRDRGE